MDYTENCLTREDIYRGKIIYVHRDQVSLPDGSASVREDKERFAYLQKNANEVGYMYFIRDHLKEITAAMREDGYLDAHPKLTGKLQAQTASRLPFENAPVQEVDRQQPVAGK